MGFMFLGIMFFDFRLVVSKNLCWIVMWVRINKKFFCCDKFLRCEGLLVIVISIIFIDIRGYLRGKDVFCIMWGIGEFMGKEVEGRGD